MDPKISVIIVNWNVGQSLKSCLDSVFATKYPSLEVIIIDNNSTDNSLKVIKSFKSLEIKLIRNSLNIGFPKGVNQGLKISTGDYLLLLNPDTRIPSDFFSDCLDFFTNHPTAGIMGPKLLDPDGKAQGSVFHEPQVLTAIKEFWLGQTGLTAKYTPDETRPTIVDAVSGACMFLPASAVEKVGKFTEAVFMYYEDLDYCRRIRAADLQVYFNPQIAVVHEHGSSSKQSPKARQYLWDASLWYSGPLKHYLMWFITWTGQKLHFYKT
jgi:GT2 family glycosyltransferase